MKAFIRVRHKFEHQFDSHVDSWKKCRDCGLCATRKKVVIYRGFVPCQIMFIGEAPGETEDVIGHPFTGPSGKLLDKLNAAAFERAGYLWQDTSDSSPESERTLRWGITNVVGCIPLDYNQNIRQPTTSEINECSARVFGLLDMCRPPLICLVGKVSRQALRTVLRSLCNGTGKDAYKPSVIELTHPAFLLREQSNRQLLERKWINKLADEIAATF